MFYLTRWQCDRVDRDGDAWTRKNILFYSTIFIEFCKHTTPGNVNFYSRCIYLVFVNANLLNICLNILLLEHIKAHESHTLKILYKIWQRQIKHMGLKLDDTLAYIYQYIYQHRAAVCFHIRKKYSYNFMPNLLAIEKETIQSASFTTTNMFKYFPPNSTYTAFPVICTQGLSLIEMVCKFTKCASEHSSFKSVTPFFAIDKCSKEVGKYFSHWRRWFKRFPCKFRSCKEIGKKIQFDKNIAYLFVNDKKKN